MPSVNQEINVNINALVKRIQDVREFVALIRGLRENQVSGQVIIDEKISRNAKAGAADVKQLQTSIDGLAASIEQLEGSSKGRLGRIFTVLGGIATVLGHLKGAQEGIGVLKTFAGSGSSGASGLNIAEKLQTASIAVKSFLSATREKIGDGLTKAKETVSGLVGKLPNLVSSGGQAAGTIGTIGVAGAVAAIGLGALAVVLGTVLAAILAIVGAVAVFGFLFNLAKGSADAGSKIHDMSQELAVSAEVLSALEVATETTTTSFDQAAGMVSKFNKLIGEAADGSKEATKDLIRLGVDPQQALKDNEAALAKVFKRIHELPTPYEKARAAQIAFKKGGEAMVPVIDAVGGSLDKAKEKAAEFGKLLNDQAAKEADEFGDQLDELGLRAEGLSQSIGRALIPELLKLLRIFSAEMPGAGGAFSFVLDVIRQKVQQLVNDVIIAIAALKTLAALPAALTVLVGTKSVEQAFAVITSKFKAELAELLTVANTPAVGGGSTGRNFDFGGTDKTKKAGSPADVSDSEFELRRVAAQNQFDQEKNLLARLSEIYQTALDDRKIAIEDFFAATQELRRREIENEITLVRELAKINDARLAAEQKRIAGDKDTTPAQKTALDEIAQNQHTATDATLFARVKELVRELEALPAKTEAAEIATLQSLDQQISAFLAKVDEANGRTAAAAAEAIDNEFRALLEKVTLEQGENSPLVKLIKEFIQLQKDRARVQQIDEQLVPLGQQFEIDRLGIETQVSREVLTQREGRRQINDLQREYLKAQLEILKNELANTTEARKQLEIKLRIAQIEKTIADLDKTVDDTARSINDSLRFAFEDFFTSIATGTKTVKEAFADLGRSILQMFAQLAAKRLVQSIFGSLLGDEQGQGGIGGILGGIFGGKKAAGDMMNARPGGQIIQVAEAGFDELVVSTDPRYAVRTSGLLGEFIRRTGILPDFARFAAGGFARSVANTFMTIPRLAAGAFVEAAGPEMALAGIGGGGDRELTIKQFNIYDPIHVHDAMRHEGGDAVFWNFVDKNAAAIKRRLKI